MTNNTLQWLPLFHGLSEGCNGYSELTGEQITGIIHPVAIHTSQPEAKHLADHLESYLGLSEAGRAALYTEIVCEWAKLKKGLCPYSFNRM